MRAQPNVKILSLLLASEDNRAGQELNCGPAASASIDQLASTTAR
jgi:hypothetical protein